MRIFFAYLENAVPITFFHDPFENLDIKALPSSPDAPVMTILVFSMTLFSVK